MSLLFRWEMEALVDQIYMHYCLAHALLVSSGHSLTCQVLGAAG